MIKSMHCITSEQTFCPLPRLDTLGDLVEDSNHVFWLDLLNPSEQELAQVAKALDLHPLAVEDASREHQRPKIEEYANFFFLVFYTVRLDETKKKLVTHELKVFVGHNYLVTVHYAPIPELDETEQRWTRNPNQLVWGIGVLIYELLDTIVDHYLPIVDSLVDQAEQMQDQIFAGKARSAQVTFELLELKKFFLEFQRIAAPERDVLNLFINRDNPLFNVQTLVYFRSVYDHIARLADRLDLYRDQLSSTMDASLSAASNELNKVMRTLTATSIILMINALIASIYGMNFVNIPELRWQYGYFGVIGTMVVITIVLILYFRRLEWV